jgi:hypothetical protein
MDLGEAAQPSTVGSTWSESTCLICGVEARGPKPVISFVARLLASHSHRRAKRLLFFRRPGYRGDAHLFLLRVRTSDVGEFAANALPVRNGAVL